MCKGKEELPIDHLHFSPEVRAAARVVFPDSRTLQKLLLQRASVEGMDYTIRALKDSLTMSEYGMVRVSLAARRQVLAAQAASILDEMLESDEKPPF